MSLSGFYGPTSEAEAFEVLARSLELGVNFWDTADIYGEGLSETRLGQFFAQDRGRREKVVLATKFSIRKLADGRRVIDNSEPYMRECLEGSMKRLGVDHVDLYYAHRADPKIPIETTIEAMAKQVKAGKIGAIGLSEISPDTLRRAHAVHPIAAVQSEYSLWTRSPELGLIQTCKELGVAFVSFSPVARGALSGFVRDIEGLPTADFRKGNPRFMGVNWARNLAWIDHFVALAKSWDWDPSALAIAWVLAKGEHILTIPGTRYAGHIEHDAGAALRPLTPAEVAEIERVLPLGFAAGDRYTDQQWGAAQRYG
jgi:aryl-alcohol dehydrogenase-like predicted oxidoreductase